MSYVTIGVIYRELREIILKYQQENSHDDLQDVAQELEVPFHTLNRFMNGCGSPSFDIITKIFVRTGNEDKLKEMFYRINSVFLNLVNDFNKDISKSFFLDNNISHIFSMKEYFFILAHAYNEKGCTRQEILQKYGEFGLERLEELIFRGIIEEKEGRCFGQHTRVSMNYQDAKKMFLHGVEFCYDPTLVGQRINWLTFQTESVDKAKAMPEIRRILGQAYQEIHKILYSKDFFGDDKIFVGMVSDEFRGLDLESMNYEDKITMAKLAHKLVHDINSPLEVIASSSNTDIFVKDALERIKGMAKELLNIHRNIKIIESSDNKLNDLSSGSGGGHLFDSTNLKGDNKCLISDFSLYKLASAIKSVVNEKQIQYKCFPQLILINDINDDDCYGQERKDIFIACNEIEIKNIISNLINNAVEAMPEHKGTIKLSINNSTKDIRLIIEDNGVGIPLKYLDRVGKFGFTNGKENGNGLGVYYAKKNIKEWGGDLEIESEENIGTKIIIKWPLSNGETNLSDVEFILIDDECLIRQHWENEAKKHLKKFKSFSTFEAFLNSPEIYSLETVIYVDYNLSNNMKGEQVAKLLYESGFKNINICSAHRPEALADLLERPWIKSVVGKKAPWC
ncbi:MAG: sensor histidine kinase [Oligoflexia bacterium]|nr:sensor histidine kinase [Oligoflexia bacterium]